MKNYLTLFGFILLFVACTPSSNKDLNPKISYDSSISYVFDAQLEKQAAAFVNGDPVSWDQLSSQDPALQELQDKHNKNILEFSKNWAQQQLGEGTQTAKLEIFTYEQKENLDKSVDVEQEENQLSVVIKNHENPNLVAQFGSKQLLWDTFLAAHTSHYQTYKSLFEQRMQRLNGIVVRRYLLDWSKKDNLSIDKYISKNIIQDPVEATQGDALAFANEKGISKTDINEEMIEKLIEIVAQNKRQKMIEDFVSKKINKDPVRVAFRDRAHKVNLPQLTESELMWGREAKESITYVGDWSCEGCKSAIKTFLEAKDKWGTHLGGALVFAFSETDRHAYMAAEAVFCAQSQGESDAWTFLKSAVKDSDVDLEQKINQAAQESKLDYSQFRDCFLKRKYQNKVSQHLEYAKSAGLLRTPLLIIGGELVAAPRDIHQLQETLKAKGISVRPPSFFTKILKWLGLS